jgi:hypothetical protein
MNTRDDENWAVLARVRVVDAVPGCASALQYREDHVQLAADDDLEFTASITLKVHDDGAFDPSGMQVYGPRGQRCLDVCSGMVARASCPGASARTFVNTHCIVTLQLYPPPSISRMTR